MRQGRAAIPAFCNAPGGKPNTRPRAEGPTHLAPLVQKRGIVPQERFELKHFRTNSTIFAAILALPLASHAQTTSSAPPVSSQSLQETQQNQAKKAKVILQRSTDEDGQTADGATTAAPPQPTTQPTVADAERTAPTTTAFDLDVRLRPAESHIAVRALVTVRNDGKSPLAHLPLQLSSDLTWEIVRLNGHPIPFTVATLNSDADHTGQLHEAAIALPTPLAPGGSLQLDVTYSGTITQSFKRLQAIGTPDEIASHSDWDRISPSFTGLRGFGNVVWYPVSSVPVILGDGARLFDEIGAHKLHLTGAHFRIAVTVESPASEALRRRVPRTQSRSHPPRHPNRPSRRLHPRLRSSQHLSRQPRQPPDRQRHCLDPPGIGAQPAHLVERGGRRDSISAILARPAAALPAHPAGPARRRRHSL
jgi:hypothetical protein